MITPTTLAAGRAVAATVAYMSENFGADQQWFVSGGFWRDYVLDRQFKDVDVCVPMHCRNIFGRDEMVKQYTDHFDGVEINIIEMSSEATQRSVAERCDFGICQISTDKADIRTLYKSKLFLADVENKTLTVSKPTSWKRRRRMLEKFPNHIVQNPDFHVFYDAEAELEDY